MLLIISGVALVCGLSLVAAGLSNPAGSPGIVASRASAHGNAVDHGRRRPFAPADRTATTALPLAHDADLAPPPRKRRERFAGDGVGQSIVQSSDARNFLMRTAMAR